MYLRVKTDSELVSGPCALEAHVVAWGEDTCLR